MWIFKNEQQIWILNNKQPKSFSVTFFQDKTFRNNAHLYLFIYICINAVQSVVKDYIMWLQYQTTTWNRNKLQVYVQMWPCTCFLFWLPGHYLHSVIENIPLSTRCQNILLILEGHVPLSRSVLLRNLEDSLGIYK